MLEVHRLAQRADAIAGAIDLTALTELNDELRSIRDRAAERRKIIKPDAASEVLTWAQSRPNSKLTADIWNALDYDVYRAPDVIASDEARSEVDEMLKRGWIEAQYHPFGVRRKSPYPPTGGFNNFRCPSCGFFGFVSPTTGPAGASLVCPQCRTAAPAGAAT
jgi:hypothetical protein